MIRKEALHFMSDPLFSIVIPTYNRADVLKRCLNSLVNQTFNKFEVIICDDGSNDHTSNVIKEFENKLLIKYIWNSNWGGPARPRNIGILNSSGKWICFLDSDDWWYPNKLEITSKYISDYDVIYHPLDEYINNVINKITLRKLCEDVFIDLIVNGNVLTNSSAVVKKELLEKVGYVAEDRKLIAIEDYDLWIRLSKITNKFYGIEIPLGAYWIGESGSNISIGDPEKILEREQYVFGKYKNELPYFLQKRGESRIFRSIALYSKKKSKFDCAAIYYSNAIHISPIKNIEDLRLIIKSVCNYIYCKAITMKISIKSELKSILSRN
jgi:glycosyltransferase involved in cell wall biosynthesis